MKNEHIVWAYGEHESGSGQVLIIGVTDTGIEMLQKGSGAEKKTLLINPPGRGFANVIQVVIFHEKDKATLKQRFYDAGLPISEAN